MEEVNTIVIGCVKKFLSVANETPMKVFQRNAFNYKVEVLNTFYYVQVLQELTVK